MTDTTVSMSLDEVHALALQVLTHHGLSTAHAHAIARVIVAGERDECHSHGVFRLLMCTRTLREGKVSCHAEPVVSQRSPAVAAKHDITLQAATFGHDEDVALIQFELREECFCAQIVAQPAEVAIEPRHAGLRVLRKVQRHHQMTGFAQVMENGFVALRTHAWRGEVFQVEDELKGIGYLPGGWFKDCEGNPLASDST